MRAIIVNLLGNETYKILKINKSIIAGGALRSIFNNTEINDFDFYFSSLNYFNNVQKYFRKKYQSEFNYESQSSVTFTIQNKQVQILRPYFGQPKDILKHFDFNIVKGYYDLKNNEYYYTKEFIDGNKAKNLKFSDNYKYYFSCFHRLKKYKEIYKFNIDKSVKEILKSELKKLYLLSNKEEIKIFINGEDYKSFDLMLNLFNIQNHEFDHMLFKSLILKFIESL